MTEQTITDFDRFMKVITPGRADPTYSLLKAHLLFEELLNAYLNSVLRHPVALAEARFTFAELLVVAKASSPHLPPDDWRWVALARLNKLRNLLAHNLEPKQYQKVEEEFIDLVVKGTGIPLPTSELKVQAGERSADPMYCAVDMATAGLFASLPIVLGLVPLNLLREAEQQEQTVEASKNAP
jgi:hypothetical protein